MRVNLIGTYNVLEAALATKDTLERIIEFSTSEVFGTYAYKVDEEHVTTQGSVGEARWTYAVSKLAGEHMAHAYHDELGLPTVSVRPFNVYGPGQIGGGAIRAFIETALAGTTTWSSTATAPRSVRGATSTTWSTALMLALEHPSAVGESFNIGNARSAVTIYDLALRDQAADRQPGRARLPGAPLHRRRASHSERRQGPRAPRLRGEGRARRGARANDRLVSRELREMTEPIRLARPDVGDEELAAVAEVVRTGQLTMGPKVEEFEGAVAAAVGTAHAAAVSSGTAALHLALLALEIGPGDEVIVPAYTFPATANVVAALRRACGPRRRRSRHVQPRRRRGCRGGHAADAGGHGCSSLRAARSSGRRSRRRCRRRSRSSRTPPVHSVRAIAGRRAARSGSPAASRSTRARS